MDIQEIIAYAQVPRLLTLSQPTVITEAIEELETLDHELHYLKAILADAAGTRRSEQLGEMNLERQLMEVVYDTEDAIGICSVQMAEAKLKNILVRSFIVSKHYHALGASIKSIRSGMLYPAIRRIRPYGRLIDLTDTNPVNRICAFELITYHYIYFKLSFWPIFKSVFTDFIKHIYTCSYCCYDA